MYINTCIILLSMPHSWSEQIVYKVSLKSYNAISMSSLIWSKKKYIKKLMYNYYNYLYQLLKIWIAIK